MTQTKAIHYSRPALHPSYLVLGAQAEITAPQQASLTRCNPSAALVLPGPALSLHVQVSVNPLLPRCLFHVCFLSDVLHSYILQMTLLFPTGILQASSIHKSLLQ